MKYIFDQTAYSVKIDSKYNATNKARADVTQILEKEGFQSYNIYLRSTPIPKVTKLIFLLRYLLLILKLRKGDELYIQYPVKKDYLTYFYKMLYVLKKRGIIICIIIHDLDYIRSDYYIDIKDIILNPLRLADKIVSHTPNMKDHLMGEGIISPISVLYLFDYLTNDPKISTDYCLQHKNEVIFAGNLKKSLFLKALNEYKFYYVKFNIYGLQPDILFSEGKEYKGAFAPDNTASIKGGWGLVWDGETLDGCSGLKGNYLKYNSSHKLSLYITAGIPVIIWSQSGLAKWITEKNLGVAIDSLKDLDSILREMSNEKYIEILNNVQIQSELLRSGKMLLTALE